MANFSRGVSINQLQNQQQENTKSEIKCEKNCSWVSHFGKTTVAFSFTFYTMSIFGCCFNTDIKLSPHYGLSISQFRILYIPFLGANVYTHRACRIYDIICTAIQKYIF